ETVGRCPALRDSLSIRPDEAFARRSRTAAGPGSPAPLGRASSPSRGGQRNPVSAQHDPSAEPPTHGTNRFPDPFAPGPAPHSGSATSTGTGTPAAGRSTPAPGDQDLRWKATAERRDLWGPIQKPLQGTVHSPTSRSVGPARRSPL